MLAPLLKQVRECGFKTLNHEILYFNYSELMNVYVGRDPIDPAFTI